MKFVHTSFHGVGHDYVQLAFQVFGFKPPIPVPEQKDPDPDFSTVKCPNPEEGESVLEISLRLAEKENAQICYPQLLMQTSWQRQNFRRMVNGKFSQEMS